MYFKQLPAARDGLVVDFIPDADWVDEDFHKDYERAKQESYAPVKKREADQRAVNERRKRQKHDVRLKLNAVG